MSNWDPSAKKVKQSNANGFVKGGRGWMNDWVDERKREK